VSAVDVEKHKDWVKLRAVVDASVYTLSKYSHGKISFEEALTEIEKAVAEIFGGEAASEVREAVSTMKGESTVNILIRIEDTLVRRVAKKGG